MTKKDYSMPFKVYYGLLKRVRTPGECQSGRPNVGTEKDAEGKKIYSRKVVIDKKGYDKGGAYWGTGKIIYVRYTLDKSYIRFTEEKEKIVKTPTDKAIPAYKKILSKIDCSAEDSPGRENIGTLEEVKGERIYQRRVFLNKGYDTGGAYWGEGDPLYVDFTLDGRYVFFHREHYGN